MSSIMSLKGMSQAAWRPYSENCPIDNLYFGGSQIL